MASYMKLYLSKLKTFSFDNFCVSVHQDSGPSPILILIPV